MPAPSRRLIYNYDSWAPFYEVQTAEDIRANTDIFAGSQVTTVMLCPNIAQSMNYPSQVSEMCHGRPQSPEARAKLHQEMGSIAAMASERIADLWRRQGVDAFGTLAQCVVDSGREAFVTFRMNDVHCLRQEDYRGPYTDAFYRENPQWRLPQSGGLNYAVPEVRAHRLANFEELLQRYPFSGLELDFARGPQFFLSDFADVDPASGPWAPHFPRDMAEGSAPILTEFVGEVHRMVQRVGREKGRRIELCVRVPSSLSGCRRVGLDPVAWHARGYLDFLTVSRFLQVCYRLPLAGFKRALPGLPVFSAIDYIVGGRGAHGVYISPRDAIAEVYRGAAAAHYAQGADGLYLFNMFAARANGLDPSGKDWSHWEPVEVLRELGDPATLEGTDKLYLVDATYDLFDLRFFDPRAPLPAAVTPEEPLIATLVAAERNPADRHCTLRVVTERPEPEVRLAVQINGRSQGAGRLAASPRLFPEPYDQLPPEPGRSWDFAVDGSALVYGDNEIAVLSSAPLTVTNIELAVRTESP